MKRNIEKFKHTHFDILIIGGGITGAAIAWDASLRGYNVGLVEKNDFGHATSMATSKLIHGGLRYLASLDFSLVRESLQERRYLSDLIPHQVRPLPFIIPIYDHNPTSKWFMGMGLGLYDLLSFDKNKVKEESKRLKNHKWLSRKETLTLEPTLSQQGLSGSYIYYDLQNIHPERVNIDFILSAANQGAVIANHLEVSEFIVNRLGQNQQILGVRVKDHNNKKEEFDIRAKTILNCSGPWVNDLLSKARNKNSQKVVLSKGIHLLMPRRQGDHAIFMETREGKHLLILPWLNYTLLGTTDTKYEGSPDNLHVSVKDAEDFLNLINEYYPTNYKVKEIIHSYVGLRSLVVNGPQAQETYKASRKHEIIDHQNEGISGLVSVVGGKYTTSRELGEQTVNYIQKAYRLGDMECKTKSTPLESANYSIPLEEYRAKVYEEWEEKYPKELLDHLLEYYGIGYKKVLALAEDDQALSQRIHASNIRIKAEIQYAIKEESAYTLSDFLYRRCGWGNEGLRSLNILKSIANAMGNILDWSKSKRELEIKTYLKKQQFFDK